MFNASLAEVGILSDSISSIADLIDEGIFKLTKEGIGLVAADRALVAVVRFNLKASAFEKYEIDKDASIGMNIGNLLSVLKRASGNDKVTLNLLESKLEVSLEGKSRRKFVLPLLDLSQEEIPPIDQLEFTSKAEMKPEVLQAGVADAEIVGDSILFQSNEGKFMMKAEGDISSSHLELEKGSDVLTFLESKGDVKARYPLDYLKKMVKAAKIADSVTVEWGQDYPMKLSFKAGD